MLRVRLGLLLLLSIGGAATLYWLTRPEVVDIARFGSLSMAAGFLLTCALAILNLAIRWFRWHFLMRRCGVMLRARDSAAVWSITLPALLTPFAVGELLRVYLLRKSYPGSGPPCVLVWLLERSCDVAILLSLWALATGETAAAVLCLAGWLLLVSLFRFVWNDRRHRSVFRMPVRILTLGSSLAAWLPPAISLWLVLSVLGEPASAGLAGLAFSKSTLAGGVVGLPLGVGVTGSLMVVELTGAGIDRVTAIASTGLFRAGTAWFAMGAGMVCLLLLRGRVRKVVKPSGTGDHFEEIASGYRDQIPEQMRLRLVRRKTGFMMKHMHEGRFEPGARGLDLGCGQGWYAAEMAAAGFQMTGVDRSARQVELARRHAAGSGVKVDLQIADALDLPFPDRSFDFIYAVNVMHHLPGDGSLETALAEIVRVLRPGGIFFLQEINTLNPLFRFYIGYIFPVVRTIDDGTESWIRPDALPSVRDAGWEKEIDFFTFMPESATASAVRLFGRLEKMLERSPVRHWSAHYVARLRKHG